MTDSHLDAFDKAKRVLEKGGPEPDDRDELLSLLKQQSADLDTLRKLSLNLTSSLDMPTVLDTIVLER